MSDPDVDDRLGQNRHRRGIEPRNIHPAVAHHVDGVLRTQALHQVGGGHRVALIQAHEPGVGAVLFGCLVASVAAFSPNKLPETTPVKPLQSSNNKNDSSLPELLSK